MTNPEPETLNGRFLRDHHPPPAPVPEGESIAFRGEVQLQSAPGSAFRPELILDESSLLPFHFLRAGDRMGRAVVKILRGDGACGTGFLVAPDVLLTNHHVLPDRASAAAARVIANYEPNPPNDPCGRVTDVPLAPEALFVTGSDLDFTFCGVAGLDHLGSVPIDRNSRLTGPSEVVNIIQHPRGRYKEVALHDNRVIKADRVVLHYSCDTEPGSSGSPVFDNQWRLVALHHASIADAQGRSSPGLDSRLRFLNEGVRMSAIALWLETDDALAVPQPSGVTRVRQLFRGLDPEVGLFGALGRSLRGRSVVDLIATEGRTGYDLDIGFWDLKADAYGSFERIANLGWSLADLRMDLWILSNASTAETCAIREQLDTHFRLEYRDLNDRFDDGTPVAVLYRKGRGISVERANLHGLPRHWIVQTQSPLGREHSIRVAPLIAQGAKAWIETIAASDHAEAKGDWLVMMGAATTESAQEIEGPWSSGREAQLAVGKDGNLLFLPGRPSAVGRLIASPNLATSGQLPTITSELPLPIRNFSSILVAPIAARLILVDQIPP